MNKPRRVIRFEDDRVMAVNIYGESIPDLCGPYEEVHEKVRVRADEKTVFQTQRTPGQLHAFDTNTRETW